MYAQWISVGPSRVMVRKGERIMAKERKVWTVDKMWKTLKCSIGGTFEMTKVTKQGNKFLRWYGVKQFLSDAAAGEKDPAVIKALMEKKFALLCNPEAKLERTESGTFHLVDPNRVVARMTNKERLEKARKSAYDEMVKNGIEPDMARTISEKITI